RARNVPADVPPQQTAILIVAAPRRRADEHVDLLTGVEVASRLRRGGTGRENRGEQHRSAEAGSFHVIAPPATSKDSAATWSHRASRRGRYRNSACPSCGSHAVAVTTSPPLSCA